MPYHRKAIYSYLRFRSTYRISVLIASNIYIKYSHYNYGRLYCRDECNVVWVVGSVFYEVC